MSHKPYQSVDRPQAAARRRTSAARRPPAAARAAVDRSRRTRADAIAARGDGPATGPAVRRPAAIPRPRPSTARRRNCCCSTNRPKYSPQHRSRTCNRFSCGSPTAGRGRCSPNRTSASPAPSPAASASWTTATSPTPSQPATSTALPPPGPRRFHPRPFAPPVNRVRRRTHVTEPAAEPEQQPAAVAAVPATPIPGAVPLLGRLAPVTAAVHPLIVAAAVPHSETVSNPRARLAWTRYAHLGSYHPHGPGPVVAGLARSAAGAAATDRHGDRQPGDDEGEAGQNHRAAGRSGDRHRAGSRGAGRL